MGSSTSVSPSLEEAFNLVGKNTPKALEICEEYKQKNPSDNWVYHIMSMAHKRMGNHLAAHAMANICVQREPNEDAGYYHRAKAAYELGKYPEAISDAQKVIELDPRQIWGSIPHRLAALSYARLGDKKNALKAAKKIPELHSGEWFPPVKPIPAGTKAQFSEMVGRMADQISGNKI